MPIVRYRFGDYVLDLPKHELLHRGEPVALQARVFECLCCLVEHRDRAVGRDELVQAVFGRPDVSVFAYDPAAVPGTGLVRGWPSWVQWLWRTWVVRRLVSLLGTRVSTVETSGKGMARLAASAELERQSGLYVQVDRPRRSSAESRDEGKQDELWRTSAELVGLPS